MMTPIKRLSVKKAPNMMKTTKYMYIFRLISYSGCSFCYNCDRKWRHKYLTVIILKSWLMWQLVVTASAIYYYRSQNSGASKRSLTRTSVYLNFKFKLSSAGTLKCNTPHCFLCCDFNVAWKINVTMKNNSLTKLQHKTICIVFFLKEGDNYRI